MSPESLFLFALLALGHSKVIPPVNNVPSCRKIVKVANLLMAAIVKDELIPDAIRFAFHSCVGGCNGCIRIDQQDNKGLQNVFNIWEKLYMDNHLEAQGISRGDFWTLGGIMGVLAGMENHQGTLLRVPCFQYFWGRQDCPTKPHKPEEEQFPSPRMSSKAMFKYFKDTFNFTPKEVAAIMGAHTIGNAVIEDTGFNGPWTPQEELAFNVTYYRNMLDKHLKYELVDATANVTNNTSPHWQWQAVLPNGNVSLMFNTDFEIFFDIDVDQNGKPICTLDQFCVENKTCGKNNVCPKAKTYDNAKTYIFEPQRFYEDFKNAFTKMLTTGFRSSLTPKGSNCGCYYDED